MLYPWHPAFGTDVDVLYEEQRRGEIVYVCLLPDDTGVVIPKWMFSAAAVSRVGVGAPRASLRALVDARAILTEVGFHLSRPAPAERAEEKINDDPAREECEKVAADGAAPERRTSPKSRRKKPSRSRTRTGKAAPRGRGKRRRKAGAR
jgi:hypothetical protein